MKQGLFFEANQLRTFVFRAAIAAIVVIMGTHSMVTGLSAHAQAVTQNNQLQSLLSNLNKEIDRREDATTKAQEALNSSTTISQQAKSDVSKNLGEVKTSLATTGDQAKKTTTVQGAQDLATSLNGGYDKFAINNAKAQLLKDSDSQQGIQQQLSATAASLQEKIDSQSSSQSGSSGGGDSGSAEEMLTNLINLITAIGAIVASIVALVLALVAGNFAEAAAIFLTILGQLAANLASILNVQSGLQVVLSMVGG